MTDADTQVGSLAELSQAERDCTRCPLYKSATQAVPGEGRPGATLMFVGEQPGDQEDLAGRPFVGPAGRMFDHALEQAGIERSAVFVTNAVKHFKHEQRGKRRLHKRPNVYEVERCRWWLSQELALVKPRCVVALGATAVRSLLGRSESISSLRGRRQQLEDGTPLYVTIHPSYLLRLRDAEEKAGALRQFILDLKNVGEHMAKRR
jgi:uracil-DNA glycosylase family protein